MQRASSDAGRGQYDTSWPSNGPSRHVSFETDVHSRNDMIGSAVGARATMPTCIGVMGCTRVGHSVSVQKWVCSMYLTKSWGNSFAGTLSQRGFMCT
jgi:hypothetical protein